MGRVTNYSYDTLGRISKMAYPGAVAGSSADTISYTSYDASGLLLQSVDGRGRITNYTYNDAEGQLTNISYPGSSAENVTYVYDAYGLPQSVTDASGTRSYTLNTSDVLTQVSTVFKKIDGTFTSAKNIGYSYNADGSRASMTTPAGTFAYSYDGGGRWTGLQDHQSRTTTWNYDALDRMTRQTMSTNVQTNFTYNALSQLVGMSSGQNSSFYSKFGHESDPAQMLLRDAAGNLKRETATYGGTNTAFNGTANYTYDNKDQLTVESSTRNAGFTNAFNYDAMGNPTSWKGTARTFNTNNQETTGGATQFSYDGNGNPTTYKGSTFAFNENDKLTQITTSGTVRLQAGYRSDGLRAWKSTANGTTYFLYDGDQLVCEFDAAGSLATTNIWGANGLMARQNGTSTGSIYYFLWDDRGNIAQLLAAPGNVIVKFTVTAWGERLSDQGSQGALDAYLGLGGQFGNYLDRETGLVLCGQRYYDSSAGRWITRDPIGTAGGLNVYGYVGNNPVNRVDPSGLDPIYNNKPPSVSDLTRKPFRLPPGPLPMEGHDYNEQYDAFISGAGQGMMQAHDEGRDMFPSPFTYRFRNHKLYNPKGPGMYAGRVSLRIGALACGAVAAGGPGIVLTLSGAAGSIANGYGNGTIRSPEDLIDSGYQGGVAGYLGLFIPGAAAVPFTVKTGVSTIAMLGAAGYVAGRNKLH